MWMTLRMNSATLISINPVDNVHLNKSISAMVDLTLHILLHELFPRFLFSQMAVIMYVHFRKSRHHVDVPQMFLLCLRPACLLQVSGEFAGISPDHPSLFTPPGGGKRIHPLPYADSNIPSTVTHTLAYLLTHTFSPMHTYTSSSADPVTATSFTNDVNLKILVLSCHLVVL